MHSVLKGNDVKELAKKLTNDFLFGDNDQKAESEDSEVFFGLLGEDLLNRFNDDKNITPQEVCEIVCTLLPLDKEMDEIEIKKTVLKGLSELKHSYAN